ncbi:MAG: UDP-N-acetylmuramate--L-alanine ligase, partial [Thermoleophilia bacterium]|nr:UDP-N-acetylmuramate--L-alanine ligase [Thermoleophilia bacterium]
SAPAAVAARLLRIPVVTTEADAHLGLANRISGRLSRRLCTAYPLPRMRRRQEVVGRPVEPRFATLAAQGRAGRDAARDALGVPHDALVVTIVGGSGGATRLNESAYGAWGADADPRVDGRELWVVHVTGRRDHPGLAGRTYGSDRYRLVEYCDDMPALLVGADLVVSRPGGSVFELAAVGRASILVPSPHVTGDHQTRNAAWFGDRGAAVVVTDADLEPDRLRSEVEALLCAAGEDRLGELERRIAGMARPDAAARIATIVAQCGGAHARRAGRVDDPTRPLVGRRFHLLGIGGAGVSALAQVCRAWGAEVSGCDQADSAYAELVRAAGVDVALGHDAAHVRPGMEVVASSALPTDHPELARARELGCRVVLRGELLGELTQLRPDTVVVAGAHGKSTTTGMLAHACAALGLDPAAALGATMPGLGPDGSATNVLVGAGPFLVEGDESDRTLLHLHCRVAVVTNIERDHHHTFTSDEEVEELFAEWVRSRRPEVLVAGPGAALDRLARHARGRVVRFGTDPAEVEAMSARLAVPGRHNALNALGAIAALEALGVDREAATAALGDFTGVGRRFEVIGEAQGVLVVDDYAHHPTEVAAAIEGARVRAREREGRVLVAFQPHLYSRTEALWSEFADALGRADRAWVLPIYGAREAPVAGVTERLIADAVVDRAPLVYAGVGVADPATGDVATIVDETMPGDVLITMGAGSITQLAPRLLDSIEQGAGAAPEWMEREVPLNRFTTIGTGGPARFFATVEREEQLVEALAWARAQRLPVAVVGLGSNSLVDDAGFGGLALRLAGELQRIEIDEERARVVLGGGAKLAAAVRLLREAGLAGFEFACAIPGTAGGALKMNAGAYGGEMRDVLLRARLVGSSGVREVVPADLDMRYRHTNIAWGEVVSEVELALAKDDPAAIRDRVKEMQARRSASQPRAARSFGSVFQNPTGHAEGASPDALGEDGAPLGAGALIERVGLKGTRIGGARISPVHGNFIENDEGGTTADIVGLIELAREQVLERFGVELHTEVHLLAPDGYRPLHDGLASDGAT